MRYLALGDSYTIGTGASSESRNYPSIIARRLTAATNLEVDLANPAVNGFTTLDLIRDELPYLRTFNPRLVSVLIGVNDLVQGRTPEQYAASLERIYEAIAALELSTGAVVAISIPNWSIVPAARDFGTPTRLRRLTDTFNGIAKHESASRDFSWVDITEVSSSGIAKKGWISSDRLHPGDAQYAAWAEVIWAAIKETWARP